MLPPVRRNLFYVQLLLLANINSGEIALRLGSVAPLPPRVDARSGAGSKVQISKICPIAQAFVLPTQTLAGRIRKEPLGARRVQQVHYTDN